MVIEGAVVGGSDVIGETPAQRHFVSTNPDWTVLGLNLGLRLIVIIVISFVVVVVPFRQGSTATYQEKTCVL